MDKRVRTHKSLAQTHRSAGCMTNQVSPKRSIHQALIDQPLQMRRKRLTKIINLAMTVHHEQIIEKYTIVGVASYIYLNIYISQLSYLHSNAMFLVHVCVCVFFPFILDIKFVGRTSRGHTRGRSRRMFHPPFCGACLNFSRKKDSAFPFPRRLWSLFLCTNDLIVLHPSGIFSFRF